MTTNETPGDAPVAVFATLRAQPGQEDAVLGYVDELRQQTLQEPGNLLYVAHTSSKEPGVVRFYELYATKEDLRAHSKSETMQRVWPALSDLLTELAEVVVTNPQWPTGLTGRPEEA